MSEITEMQNLVNALGWMLVHFIWQGTLIAGVLWAIFRLSRPDSAVLRYWSGLAAYLACAMAPLITFVLYLGPSVSLARAGEVALPAFNVATGYRVTAWQFLQGGLEPALPFIVALWAIGVALVSSRTFMGWLGTRRLVRHGTKPVRQELLDLTDRLRASIGVRKIVRVLSSTRVAVPTLIGWLKPVILLPASVLANLPQSQLEMILAHELAHVRRNDYLINLLQLVIETLFFYHPAVRWMSRHVGQEREHCCDDMVVARCGQPVVYARALASLEALRGPVVSPALSATGGDLFQRVSRIVRQDLPRRSSGFAQVLLIAGVAVTASLGARHGMEIVQVNSTPEAAPTAQHSAGLRQSSSRAALGSGLLQYGQDEQARREQAARLEQLTMVPVTGKRLTWVPPQRAQIEEPALLLASLEPPVQQTVFEEAVDAPPEDLFESTFKILKTVSPDYPSRAERRGIEGYVKLRFTLSGGGKPVNIEVEDAQPTDLFDKSAIKALRQWQFDVDAGHDPGEVLSQVFDFAFVELVPDPGLGTPNRRCTRTGTRLCRTFETENDY